MDLAAPGRTPDAGQGSSRPRRFGLGLACGLLAAALLGSPDAALAQAAAGAMPVPLAAAGAQAEMSHEAIFSQGVNLENQGNLAEAVKLYEHAAKAGSAAAARKLGDIYRSGKGSVGRDAQASLRYYALAKQIDESPLDKATQPQAVAERATPGPNTAAATVKAQEEAAAKANAEYEAAAARAKAQEEAAAKANAELEAARFKARVQQEAAAKAKAELQAAAAKARAEREAAAAAEAKARDEAAAKAKAEQQVAATAQAEREAAAREREVKAKLSSTQVATAAPATQEAANAEALYRQGLDLERRGNVAQAVKLYAQAAHVGSAAASKKLGEIYATGKGGVRRDTQMSLRYNALARLEAAASAKTAESQAGAGRAKAEQDAAKANAEKDAAAAQAKARLEAAVKAQAEQETAKAKAEQEAAARAKQEAAATARADQGTAAKTPPSPIALAAPGAQPAKNSDALYTRGLELENQGNVVEAVKLYEQAARAGSGPAARKLGEIYGTGKGGVARDGQASMRYQALAKQRGETIR